MNAFGHFYTITKHRHKVMEHCFKVGIFWQGLLHDLSKYSPTEFINSAKFYSGTRSPIVDERRAYGYSVVWMHHKGRNKHHFEYWRDLDVDAHAYVAVKMPLKYVKEMFCDRIAASKIYQGKKYTDAFPYAYFKKENFADGMHPQTYALIESLLLMLSEKGERETFAYVKSLKEY